MRVKNKYIEGVNKKIRQRLYDYLDDEIVVFCASKDTPKENNVYQSEEYSLIVLPTHKQIPFVTERVKSLYHYLPDMRDIAEELSEQSRGEALMRLSCIQTQYDPDEVYDFLMQGLKENTLHNFIEFQGVKEYEDITADRHLFIADVYVKGEWTALTCVSSGITSPCYCCVNYWNKEQKQGRAMRHFSEHLSGEDKQALESFISYQIGKELE